MKLRKLKKTRESMRDRSRPLVALAVATVVFLWGLPIEVQGQGGDRLELYLTSLRLDRLLVRHLENQVNRELDPERRLRKAKRLADLYADQLLDSRVTAESADRWMRKAEALVKVYPSVENPRLKIAELQSRYLVEESSFRNWWNTLPHERPEELSFRWRELQTDLAQFNAILEQRYQEFVAAVQLNNGEIALSRQLGQVENLLLHSSFLLGWSTYFRGILETEDQMDLLRAADEHFREFLQIESRKSMTEFSEQWFDFNSTWQLRGLVGLAMCQRGLKHPQQSEYCFELIRTNYQGRDKDLCYVWDLNSRHYVGDDKSTVDFVQHFKTETDLSGPGKIGFWVAALKAGAVIESRSPEMSRILRRESLAGLTRMMQSQLIEELQKKYAFEFEDDFLGNWVRGYLLLAAAAPSDKSDLEEAKASLERALQQVDTSINEADVARCRYLLAKLHYRAGMFETAAGLFQSASRSIADEDRAMAAESQWLAARSLAELGKTDERKLGLAYMAIDNLIRRFPESSLARRAEFEKLKLNMAGLPDEEAIRRLQKVTRKDPNYPLALYEIARTRFRLWLTAFQTGKAERAARLTELLEAERATRNNDAVSDEKKLKSILLAIDALLRDEPINEPKLASMLQSAAAIADSIGDRPANVFAEYRYYRMNFYQKTNQTDEAKAEARWMVQNASNTPYQRAALIYLGRVLDSECQRSADVKPELLEEALDVYRRLVAELGSTADELKNSNNARVATKKLGELESLAGNIEEADRIFSLLVETFPNHQDNIHELAKTKMRLGQYRLAWPLWRKLNAGVPPGTDIWYESKHQLITCIQDSDSESARQVLRQTIRLSPEMPSKWQLLFDQLQAKLAE